MAPWWLRSSDEDSAAAGEAGEAGGGQESVVVEPPPSTAEIKLNEIVSAAMGEESPLVKSGSIKARPLAGEEAPAEASETEAPEIVVEELAVAEAAGPELASDSPSKDPGSEDAASEDATSEDPSLEDASLEETATHELEAPAMAVVEEDDVDEEGAQADGSWIFESAGDGPEEAAEEDEPASEADSLSPRPRRRRRRRRRRPAADASEAESEAGEDDRAIEDEVSEAVAEAASSFALARQQREEPPVAAMVVPEPAAAVRGGETVELAALLEALVSYTPPERTVADERNIAVFCDLENLALGMKDTDKDSSPFDIDMVLERLLEKGKVSVKRAYADWQRYSDYKRAFHESAIEMIDIPQKRYSGKNSADIKLAVDAMELCYTKDHLDTFVVVSGDSDFSPLVSKLRENDKYVIGIGMKNSTSTLLVDNCDEFIYYESVWRDAQDVPALDHLDPAKAEVFGLMVDSILALMREGKEVLWGSMIKQTMKRKRPSFNEGTYGYGSFSELLEDAQASKIVRLRRDRRSGSYVVTGFAQGD